MDEHIPDEKVLLPTIKKKEKRPEVIVVRNWKEYFGDSLLIIFSVGLAIILTEIFNKIHENQRTHEIFHELRAELIGNLESEEQQYQYYLQVFKNIDSALNHEEYMNLVFAGERIHIFIIAPHGIKLRKDLNDVAWQVARQTDVYSKISLETYSLITDIYNEQQRFNKTEDEVAKVLLSFESRKPENKRITLILMHDNIDAWAVLRTPDLLNMYKKAIDKLSNY
jgi:hypothetical protein